MPVAGTTDAGTTDTGAGRDGTTDAGAGRDGLAGRAGVSAARGRRRSGWPQALARGIRHLDETQASAARAFAYFSARRACVSWSSLRRRQGAVLSAMSASFTLRATALVRMRA